jgi:hypothetical protein
VRLQALQTHPRAHQLPPLVLLLPPLVLLALLLALLLAAALTRHCPCQACCLLLWRWAVQAQPSPPARRRRCHLDLYHRHHRPEHLLLRAQWLAGALLLPQGS